MEDAVSTDHLMEIFRRSFVLVIAAITLFAFAGDLAADTFCKTIGCAEMSTSSSHQDGENSCDHCICATHATTLPIPPSVELAIPDAIESSVVIAEQQAPEGSPAAIDHPPQLS
jgi:hypothetical protein